MKISKEYCGILDPECVGGGIIKKSILACEIDGIQTTYIQLPEESSLILHPEPGTISVFLMLIGKGNIRHNNLSFAIDEVSLFAPVTGTDITILSGRGLLGLLEIRITLTESDIRAILEKKDLFPYFMPYSKCRKYRESIKSEKTISRMILPENIVPRFCVGSVETTGPDNVSTHSHPMLEQFFFGLPGNQCTVHADGEDSQFVGNFLLHIPLGSEHAVSVETGNQLHYIWMDLFRSLEDMEYMQTTHIMEDQ